MEKTSETLGFVKQGLLEYLKGYEQYVHVDMRKYRLHSYYGGYMDIIGDSDVEDKFRGNVYYEIKLTKDKKFEVRDIRVIGRDELEVYETFDGEKTGIACDDASINKAYIQAIERMNKYIKDNGLGYTVRVFIEKVEGKLPVLKLAGVKRFHELREGKYLTKDGGVGNIYEAALSEGCTPYEPSDIISLVSGFVDEMTVECTITYQKYGEEKQVLELSETYEGVDGFGTLLYELRREIEAHNLKAIGYEQYGMDIERMDELAGYFAMEYLVSYDVHCRPNPEYSYKDKLNGETFYDVLHRQMTVQDYCENLQSFLYQMPLDTIAKGYELLKTHPDRDVMDVFHQVCGSHHTDGYVEGTVYLAAIYRYDIVRAREDDPDVVLLSEREQYKSGREVLMRHTHPIEFYETVHPVKIIGKDSDGVYIIERCDKE